MKRKKRKFKNKIFILLILFISIIFFYYLINYLFISNVNVSNLKNKGYTNEEISLLNENEEILKYASINEYNEDLIKLIKSKDFDQTKFENYIKYLKDNECSVIDAVYIVNNDINYEYSKDLVGIIKEKYFIITRLQRYMNYLDKNNDYTYNEVVTLVNCNRDLEYYVDAVKTDISYNELMIANKHYSLDNNFEPDDLVVIENNYTKVSNAKLSLAAYEAFKELSDAAKKEGLSILAQSAYRSYETQNNLYNKYKQTNGITWADTWSARAGYSEHQTGLALDVLSKNVTSLGDFENTNEYEWLLNNSYKYGFILRYPEDKTEQTGYNFESWHYRYVGKDVAQIIHDEDLSFDEYFAYYVLKK
ncbi:MAG: D-alanyl-D-alanine carboxypeptidase family protein [Bacilli bacterium]|nr:D-alanyl-D-alanine carboxypeptidase family protein [Bacilli bacterium]